MLNGCHQQDFYHKMIELSSEARMAYEVMLSNLEQASVEEELQTSPVAEKIEPSSGDTQPEQPEYSKCDKLTNRCAQALSRKFSKFVLCLYFLVKIWNKIFEKDHSNQLLNFEKQLSFMHLECERFETANDEQS